MENPLVMPHPIFTSSLHITSGQFFRGIVCQLHVIACEGNGTCQEFWTDAFVYDGLNLLARQCDLICSTFRCKMLSGKVLVDIGRKMHASLIPRPYPRD